MYGMIMEVPHVNIVLAISGAQGNKENSFAQNLTAENSEDAVEWVRTRLEFLDFRVKSSELTPSITHCLQQLLMEVCVFCMIPSFFMCCP